VCGGKREVVKGWGIGRGREERRKGEPECGKKLDSAAEGDGEGGDSSPPHAHATGQHSSPENGANEINCGAISMPHLNVVKSEVNSNPSIPNGVHNHQSDGSSSSDSNGNAVGRANSPARPKSQNQHHMNIPINGYHLTPMNRYTTTALTNTMPYLPSTGLSMQQVQNLKLAFANMPPWSGSDFDAGEWWALDAGLVYTQRSQR
jgi:hypothetical protein